MNRLITTLTVSALLASSLLAQDDRENTAQTGWWLKSSQTVTQMGQMFSNGYRPIDLEVRTVAPLTFSATFVKDSGAYDKTWWWYYGKTAAQIGALTSGKRLIKLTPYVVNGATRYCAIFVSNTGSNSKGWYWWYGRTLAYIKSRCSALNARLVDVESHVINGTRYYCGVGIKNTGADYRLWKVLDNQTAATIPTQTGSTYRVYDIERTAPGKYDVIYVRPKTFTSSWWCVDRSISQLDALAKQNGARIFDIERFVVNGTAYYLGLMIQNTNALTTKIGRQIRSQTDGSSGFVLKQINGSTYAGLQTSFKFDPASTIKQLHGAYAYRQALIQASVTEKSLIGYRDGPCPYTTGNLKYERLEDAVLKVLESSDNRLTDAIEKRFGGKSKFHAFANSLGMTDTRSNRIMGCTAPPFNTMTLNDLVKLHTAIAGGLLGKYRDDFIVRMRNARSNFPSTGPRYMDTVLSGERAKAGLDSAEYKMFSDRFQLAYKPGAKTIQGKAYRTTSGWAQIPFVVNNTIVLRQFVWGAFAHGASNATNAENAISNAAHELLRDRIAAAMVSFQGFDLGSFTKFGVSCAAGTKLPSHDGSGYPTIGHRAYLWLRNAPSYRPAMLWVGVSKSKWNGANLPLNLGVIGATGCRLYVSPDLALAMSTGVTGIVVLPASIPNSKSLVGLSVHTQFAISANRQNPAGFVTTNGMTTLIGGKK